MLLRLHIQNYALIDEAEVTFDSKLNIITGETGAGKSILLGALSLILGQRADAQSLLDKSRKCIVEGEFKTEGKRFKTFFGSNDIDFQPQTIIRREINSEGKSRVFINDTPVNLGVLRELTSMLVDIHSQHETLQVMQKEFQLSLVDAFADNETLLNTYQDSFSIYRKISSELETIEESEKKSAADIDYFRFQFTELDSANLKAGELEQLETELKSLQHAEEIRTTLGESINALSGEQEGIASRINSVLAQLNSVTKFHPPSESIVARLKSVHIEVKDILSEIEDAASGISYNAEKVQLLEERIDLLNRLLHKHRASSVDELIVLSKSFEEKISAIDSAGEKIEALRQQKEKAFSELKTLAERLSASRKKIIPAAEKKISRLLAELRMPDTVFKIEQQFDMNNISSTGADEILFLFSANKGIAAMPIAKVASGGELSRLMLAIKASVAKQMSLPTMIFDEIDSGVSGEVALKVGNVMKEMSSGHQIIAITHLPQIASRADAHFMVSKQQRSGKTNTVIEILSEEEHTLEIAKMIAGGKPSAAAIQNAKELIG